MARPVVIVTDGTAPGFVQTTDGPPATPVESGFGAPIQLVDSGGPAICLVNDDGSAWSGSLAYTGLVSQRARIMGGDDGATTGNAKSLQSYSLHTLIDECNEIEIGFGAWKQSTSSTGSESGIASTIQVRGILEVDSVQYPLTFGGNATHTFSSSIAAASSVVFSDPVTLPSNLAADSQVAIWWEVVLANAFLAQYGNRALTGDLAITSTSTTPPTTLGEDTTGWTNAAHVGPTVVRASRRTNKAAILYKGDSNLVDQTHSKDTVQDLGGLPRALIGSGHGVIKVASTGIRLDANKTMSRSLVLADQCGVEHAIIQLGVNDLTIPATFAEMQADAEELVTALAAVGITAHFCTLTVRGNGDTYGAVRIEFNDWIRTDPTGFGAHYELADLCETSRNSGVWKSGYHNGDYLHIKWDTEAIRNEILADHLAWLETNGII